MGGRSGQGGFWKPVPRKLGAWRLCWAATGDEGGRGNVMMGQTGACPVIACSLHGWTRCQGNQERSQALETGRRGIKGRFYSLLSPARPALPSPPLGCLRGTSNLTRRTPHPHPPNKQTKVKPAPSSSSPSRSILPVAWVRYFGIILDSFFLSLLKFYLFIYGCCSACGILVPQPGIRPRLQQ